MICERTLILSVSSNWPEFLYTDLFSNNGGLSAVSIGGYDHMFGLPANSTNLGASVTTTWTVTGVGAYTIAYRGDSVATAANAGNWRITIDNASLIVPTLSFPIGVEISVNAVPIYYYSVDASTGPLFVDTAISDGDTLSFIFAIDGNLAIPNSYQISIAATQLP